MLDTLGTKKYYARYYGDYIVRVYELNSLCSSELSDHLLAVHMSVHLPLFVNSFVKIYFSPLYLPPLTKICSNPPCTKRIHTTDNSNEGPYALLLGEIMEEKYKFIIFFSRMNRPTIPYSVMRHFLKRKIDL